MTTEAIDELVERRVTYLKSRGHGMMTEMMLNEVEEQFIEMAQGGDGTCTMQGNIREEYYKEREKPGDHEVEAIIKWQDEMSAVHGKAEIIIGKQRHGPIGTVDLSFESQYTKFGNLAKMHQQKSNTQ